MLYNIIYNVKMTIRPHRLLYIVRYRYATCWQRLSASPCYVSVSIIIADGFPHGDDDSHAAGGGKAIIICLYPAGCYPQYCRRRWQTTAKRCCNAGA